MSHDGKIAAVAVANRLLITESEAKKFLKEWPSRNRGISARWRDYRAWKAGRDCAAPEGGSQ